MISKIESASTGELASLLPAVALASSWFEHVDLLERARADLSSLSNSDAIVVVGLGEWKPVLDICASSERKADIECQPLIDFFASSLHGALTAKIQNATTGESDCVKSAYGQAVSFAKMSLQEQGKQDFDSDAFA